MLELRDPLRSFQRARKSMVVLLYRSPTFLWLSGGIALAASIGTRQLTNESTLMWALLLIACPPIFEASASRTAGQIGAVIYDKDADDIERLAYRPIGALLRCCYLFCFLTAIVLLGRGGYDLVPDDGWAIAAIMSPFAAYVYWAGTAYWSSITALAQREQWQKRSRSRT